MASGVSELGGVGGEGVGPGLGPAAGVAILLGGGVAHCEYTWAMSDLGFRVAVMLAKHEELRCTEVRFGRKPGTLMSPGLKYEYALQGHPLHVQSLIRDPVT